MRFKDDKTQTYLEDALLELQELSSREIKEVLEKVSEANKNDRIPVYPFVNQILEPNGQKKYVQKEIEAKDATKLAQDILVRMLSYLANEAYRIGWLKEMDLREFCSWLNYLDTRATEEEKDSALEKFDDKFSYLENIRVYNHIYNEFRRNYFVLLKEKILYVAKFRKFDEERLFKNIVNANIVKKPKPGCAKKYYWEE